MDFYELVERLQSEYVIEVPSVQELVKAWRRELFDHLTLEEQNKRYKELVCDVLPKLLAEHVKATRRALIWDSVATLRTMLLTWGDSVSDVFALWLLFQANSPYRWAMLIALVIANLVQTLMTHFVQREGPFTTIAALFALKPLVEGFKIIFGIEDEGTAFDAKFNFAMSRLAETGLESSAWFRDCTTKH